jgi:hypothetical protein
MFEESDARLGFRFRDLAALVGIAIILLALVSYGLWRAHVSEKRATTNNNLRQCGVAVHTAVGDYRRLPPSGTSVATGTQVTPGGYGSKTGSLYFHILPYMESSPYYNDGTWNVRYLPYYHAPSDPSEDGQVKGTSFPFNGLVFNQGGNKVGKGLSEAMPDGTANTIMFGTGAIESNTLRDATMPDPTTCNITGTTLPQFDDWYPGEAKLTVFQAFGSSGLAVCMGDANTRQVSPHVSAASWKAVMVPDDKAIPGSDF